MLPGMALQPGVIAGSFFEATAVGGPEVWFNAPYSSDSGGWSNYTIRAPMSRFTAPPSADSFRVQLRSADGEATRIQRSFLGTGLRQYFSAPPVAVTVGGQADFTIPAGQSVWTDPIVMAYDGSQPLIYSAFIPAGASANDSVSANALPSSGNSWAFGDLADSTSPSGFTALTGLYLIVSGLESAGRNGWEAAFERRNGFVTGVWGDYTIRTKWRAGFLDFTSMLARINFGFNIGACFVGNGNSDIDDMAFTAAPQQILFDGLAGRNENGHYHNLSDALLLALDPAQPVVLSFWTGAEASPIFESPLGVSLDVRSKIAAGNSAGTLGFSGVTYLDRYLGAHSFDTAA